MIPGNTYTFDMLLQIAWRRKWLIVLPAIVIAAASVVVIQRLPNLYRSEALILVVPQRVPESYVRSTITARIEDRLNSITQQIMSRTKLEQIVQDFNLYPKERADQELMEDIVEHMRTRDVKINVVKGDAFRVAYLSSDPRTAMRVTERLASLFIDESLRDREVLAEGTSQFLATQLDEARRQLVLTENKLQEYERMFNGELPSQESANLQGLHNTEMALQNVGEALNRDRERKLVLERSIADIVETPDPVTIARATKPDMRLTLMGELQVAQQSLLALELKLLPEHPDVRKAKRTVEDLEKRIEAYDLQASLVIPPATTSNMDPVKRRRLTEARAEFDNLDRQIAAKQVEEDRLRATLGMYQARIEAAPTREAELAGLTRDYETQQETYRTLLQKQAESQISANLEKRQIGEQFKVLDPARVPERPVSPDRPRLYLLTIVAALAIGFGLAVAAEYFDRTLRTEADVRAALNLLVLATVPPIRDAAAATRRWRRNLAVGAATMAVLGGGAAVAWKLLS